MAGILNTPEVNELLTLVGEAARSTEASVMHFIEPAAGTLRTATSRRHHIVFGRRGSGKTSLLNKAGANLTLDRRPIAYVEALGSGLHSSLSSRILSRMKTPMCFVLLLALLKKLLLSDNLSQDNQEKLYKWLSWAMQHADRLNPLHNSLPFEAG